MPDAPAAPEPGAPQAEPATPEHVAPTAPIRVPDDHPLLKAYEATRSELKSLKDAANTGRQKAADDLAAETARADGMHAELIQLRAALRHGLDIEDVDLLGTGTEDEIEARAKRLADRSATTPYKHGKPTPREGATPPPPKSDPMRELTRQLFNGAPTT